MDMTAEQWTWMSALTKKKGNDKQKYECSDCLFETTRKYVFSFLLHQLSIHVQTGGTSDTNNLLLTRVGWSTRSIWPRGVMVWICRVDMCILYTHVRQTILACGRSMRQPPSTRGIRRHQQKRRCKSKWKERIRLWDGDDRKWMRRLNNGSRPIYILIHAVTARVQQSMPW